MLIFAKKSLLYKSDNNASNYEDKDGSAGSG